MGTLAPGQRQRRRLPETAPSSAPRPRPAWPPGRPAARPPSGPAQPALSARITRAAPGEAGAAPGPAPSPPGGCGWARAGHVFLRICCTGWGAHWGAAGVERQFGKIESRKRCQSRREKERPAVTRAPGGCRVPSQGRAEEGPGLLKRGRGVVRLNWGLGTEMKRECSALSLLLPQPQTPHF